MTHPLIESRAISIDDSLRSFSLFDYGTGSFTKHLNVCEGLDLVILHTHDSSIPQQTAYQDAGVIFINCILRGTYDCYIQNSKSHFTNIQNEGTIYYLPSAITTFSTSKNFTSVSLLVSEKKLQKLNDKLNMNLANAISQKINYYQQAVYNHEIQNLAFSLFSAFSPNSHAKIERNNFWVEGVCLTFLGAFLENIKHCSNKVQTVNNDTRKLLLAREYLLSDLTKAPSLIEVSAISGLSLSKLKTEFKSHFGNTVYGTFKAERMEKARLLLMHKQISVTDVAVEIGYSNMSHFSAAFKQHFGILPSTFLKNQSLQVNWLPLLKK